MALPRYRRPKISSIGAATKRKLPTRRMAYAAVTRRAKGHCELCGLPQDPLDPHHAFKRGHLPGIPADICDSEDLIIGVCRTCHDRIEGIPGLGIDSELQYEARLHALERFAARYDLEVNHLEEDLVDEMRRLVRVLEEREEAA